MTRRCSVRAAAREIYGELAQGEAGASVSGNPDPPSLRSGATSLTAKVRELYEDSAVPVAEIARLCGVTDRTIYKYAAKQGWKPRYRWSADGGRPAAFAPAKGAGGRFIRRDDIGHSVATGLKAVDPAGRGLALRACGKARRLSRAAQQLAEIEAARAELRREVDQSVATLRHMVRYLSEIRKIEALQQERAAALSGKEQDKAKLAEEHMQMRVELARRIAALTQQYRSGTE